MDERVLILSKIRRANLLESGEYQNFFEEKACNQGPNIRIDD